MPSIISMAFAISGSILVAIALYKVFQRINPANVTEYLRCQGEFWESELNNCSIGLDRVPQQPVNTYTNVLYLTGGLLVMFEFNTLPTFVFSLAALFLCIASALFHALSNYWSAKIDVSAMYAIFTALVVYAATTFFVIGDPLVALIMFIVAAIMGYLLTYVFSINFIFGVPIIALLVFALLIFSRWQQGLHIFNVNWVVSLTLLLVGIVTFLFDKWRIFPIPRWGHGFWHILTAIAIPLLFYSIYSIN